MSSLYAQYLTEKTNDSIIESKEGFASYRYLKNGTKDSVYIVDVFVIPEARKSGIAKIFADKIVEEAKGKGCTELLGTIIPSNKDSSVSLLVLLAYGMKLESSNNNLIVFRKDI